MHHRIILKTNNGKSSLKQRPEIAARLIWFHVVGLLGLILILAVFFLSVASAQAGSRGLAANQHHAEIMALASHVEASLVEGPANLAVPLGQGPNLSLEIEQYPYAYVPNNSGTPPPPEVFLVHAKVTNMGPGNATGVTVELNNLSGLALLDSEDPLRHPPDLAPGDTYQAYWFVTCPRVCSGGSYKVTVRLNDTTVTEAFHSVLAKKIQATGSGSNLESLGGCDAVANNVFSMTVEYTGLQGKREIFFGPVGNADFLPSAYRLVDSKVRFASQDYDNKLYFPSADGDSAEVTYYFEILETPGPGTGSPLCPYVAHYHNNNKAATFSEYCSQSAGFICVPSDLPLPEIEVTKNADPGSVDEPGGQVTFSVTVNNTGPKAVKLTGLVDNIHGDLDGQGSCAVPQTIGVGQDYQCQFEATVSGQPGESETDTVTATAEDDNGNQTTASDSATVTIDEILPGPGTGIIYLPLILKTG